MHLTVTNSSATDAPMDDAEKALYGFLIVFLVIASGGTAGLQVALFSIDRVFLRVLQTTGDDTQRRQAEKLLRVLNLQHWTLVSLILLNAFCMMSLPILLDRTLDPLTALIVSTTAVLFLGEVIPLSLFVRWAMPICAFFCPVIWVAIAVTSPVSYPVGKLLDWLLGREDQLLDRDDIAALIMATPPGLTGSVTMDASAEGDITVRTAATAVTPAAAATVTAAAAVETAAHPDNPYRLRETEARMLQGAMQLSTDTVREHLRVSEANTFMLSSQDVLDRETIQRVLMSGFSRVPVYFGADRRHVIGALIVNSLLRLCFASPNPPPLVGDYPLREVMRLSEAASLYDAYVAFRDGTSRMAVVYNAQGMMIGILTITDVLACMYHASTAPPPPISAAGLRRREKMRELVEGMKYLNAAKSACSASLPSTTVVASPVRREGKGTVAARPLHAVPPLGERQAPGEASPTVVEPRGAREGSLSAAALSTSDLIASLPQFSLDGSAAGDQRTAKVPSPCATTAPKKME